jgi:hypothetical protein
MMLENLGGIASILSSPERNLHPETRKITENSALRPWTADKKLGQKQKSEALLVILHPSNRWIVALKSPSKLSAYSAGVLCDLCDLRFWLGVGKQNLKSQRTPAKDAEKDR